MPGAAAGAVDATPVDRAAAAAIEAAEARAWADLYAAAPPRWAAQVDLGQRFRRPYVRTHWTVR